MSKVAVIQMRPAFMDKAKNLRTMACLVKEAADGGAAICVLPELALNGYSFMREDEAREQAEVIHPEVGATKAMWLLAKTFNIHIAWGLIEKDVGTGHLYNSQVLMCPDGRYETMRKINRWGNDFIWARSGQANPPILECNLGGISKKVGLLICRDVRDKKDDHWDSFYEKGDADLILFSSAWGKGGFPATAWMEFVEENDVPLCVSNRYGVESSNDFGEGGSCIILPPDRVICEGLVWNQNCIIYGEV